jgi:sterol desaturase/sphingolipid hydroxylase (fatty acid hydroxylase superfamily)
MVSNSSIIIFFTINGTMILLGTVSHALLKQYDYTFMPVFVFNMFIMTSMAEAIRNSKADVEFISKGQRPSTFNTTDYIKTIVANSFSYYVITHGILDKTAETNLLYFIPISFLYELLLDLCHYSAHRALHSVPALYKYIHKKHHSEHYIQVYTSFNHTMLDYFLTNTVPLAITSYIVPMSPHMFTIQFCYKVLVEIGGHSGKFAKAGSFPQCIWLPLFFNIALSNVDHNEHHINPMVNFSKRFSIWDKLFGTYADKNHV